MDDVEKFSKWVNGAQRGERYIYFVGASVPTDESDWARGVRRLFVAIYKMHAKGVVMLVQRRVPFTSNFEYTAIRTSYPRSCVARHEGEGAAA